MTRKEQVISRHMAQAERQMIEDVVEVLKTSAGRRLFMAMVTKSGIYKRSESGRLEYDAGRRDAGLEALAIANRYARVWAGLAADERDEAITAKNSELEQAEEQDRKERERGI